MNYDAQRIVGALAIRPGAVPSIVCTRPVIGESMMQRLVQGRPAATLPGVIASVFTLCAAAQRQTAQRAVQAALGTAGDPEHVQDRLALAASTAREHLLRLALELPMQVPRAGVAIDPFWLRDAPVLRLPPVPDRLALQQAVGALPAWLEQQLLGMTPERWLAGWQQDGEGWLAHWATLQPHPAVRWLDAVRDEARAIALPGRPLDVLDDPAAGMPVLAAALAGQPGFAERPLWCGAPAETGPWTRLGHTTPVHTAWARLGARIADLLRVACGERPACGALGTAPGEGIAWSEMSRGLLVHWVRLAPGERDPASACAERYHVLAPTEWNFHPDGALGRALAGGQIASGSAQLATAVLDPCVPFSIEKEAPHA